MLVCGAVDVPAYVLKDVPKVSVAHVDVPAHVQVDVPPP